MYPKPVQKLPFRRIDDRAVLIHPRLGQVHELDEVGAFLFAAADGVRSFDELTRLVLEEFEEGSPAAVRTDVEEFFEALEKLGMVECRS